MAKRKAARTPRRSSGKAPRRNSGRAVPRSGARKVSRARKASRKRAAPRKTAKKAAPKRQAAPKRTRKSAKPAAKPRALARKAVKKKAAPKPAAKATRKVVSRPATAAAIARKRPVVPLLRKPPGLDRERRIVSDEDEIIQNTPPSSLDLDRTASAVRTGRKALKDRFDAHTETSPALTAGDVDADWESAYSVGDEAPGGDNPTPDQDIVDDIGRAVGVEYQDNEELKGEEKIIKRDRNRWELDPASSDDWDDR